MWGTYARPLGRGLFRVPEALKDGCGVVVKGQV